MGRLKQQHVIMVMQQRRAHASLCQLIIPAISQRSPHKLRPPHCRCNRCRRRFVAGVRREALTALRRDKHAGQSITPGR